MSFKLNWHPGKPHGSRQMHGREEICIEKVKKSNVQGQA